MFLGRVIGRLVPAGRTLAVAGTHGKTSTSWLLHHALAGLAGVRATDVTEILDRWKKLTGPMPDMAALRFTDKERGAGGKRRQLWAD